jgi:hypothetical protein
MGGYFLVCDTSNFSISGSAYHKECGAGHYAVLRTQKPNCEGTIYRTLAHPVRMR